MVDLESRLEILEALVARLLRERFLDLPAPHQPEASDPPPRSSSLLTWERIEPPPPVSPSAPLLTQDASQFVHPEPHPAWLPVVHANGSTACGRPGLFLTQRVSGVHKAGPNFVRILPRLRDPATGIWITEPFRAPVSSDLVVCASCASPLEIWSSQDLDYRPHLDNEIGQPMHPKAASAASPTLPDIPQASASPTPTPFTDDERLAQLKAQAAILRDQASQDRERVYGAPIAAHS